MATILVVDDRPVNREFLGMLLSYAGHRVIEAADGDEALTMARQLRPDLVISDIVMPTMDGIEFVKRLHADTEVAHIPIIFYTASYRLGDARNLLPSSGVAAVLSKPSKPQIILDAVVAALGSPVASVVKPTPIAESIPNSGPDMNLGLRLSTLIELGLELPAQRDPRRLLDLACRASRKIFSARYAAAGIVEEAAAKLCHYASQGFADETGFASLDTRSGLLGAVLKEGKPCNLCGLAGTAAAGSLPVGHPPIDSLLAVPLWSARGACGWLYVANPPGGDSFGMADEQIAMTLAAKLALSYENLHLHDALQRYASRLARDAEAIKQLNIGLERQVNERRISETRFRLAMEAGTTIAYTMDCELRYTWAHSCRPGFDAQALIGKTDFDLLTDETARTLVTLYRQVIETGTGQRRDVAVRRLAKPLEQHYFEVIVEPLKDADGEANGIICAATDITERKRAEASSRIAAIAFESQEGMIVTDTDGVILRVNRAFTEITGYSAEEAVGQTPKLLKSGRHDKAFYAEMWESLRCRGIWQGEIWDRRKNGEVYPEWLTITAVTDEAGNPTHYVGTLTDITQRKAAADEIAHLAFYDPLTQLPNRRLLLDRLRQALAASSRRGHNGALLFIDLDNFKTLNDIFGHDVGDLLLQQVAQRLVTCVREGDTAARQGGDEFVVMLDNLSADLREAAAQTETVGKKILAILDPPFQLAAHRHRCTASIGAALFNQQQNSVEELLKRADLAMYQAKAAGRNTLRFFDPQLQAVVATRAALEADLRQGLEQGDFLLHYQPQVDLAGRITGAEALLRWQHPRRGLILPANFIPLAEETGLILPLGHWVLETACSQLAAWAALPAMAPLTLAVNVSARQFHQPDFVDQVLAVLDRSGADPQKLKLELTESLLLEDVDDITAKMVALKAEGVCCSLDDFGTGYSSLAYLKRLPLDRLKIDQSFVSDVLIDPNDAAIAKTVIALAENLGLGVIAEGVETEAQRDFLAGSGCYAFQGHFFSRPVPLADFKTFVQRA